MRLSALLALALPLAGGLVSTACGSSSTATPAPSGGGTTCVSGSISASGSTALQPLVQNAALAYRAACPGATISVSGGGSSAGLSNVAAGTSDIGDSDVPAGSATGVDASTLEDHQVAIVVFAVAVNNQAGVTNLTTGQLRDVFSGKVSNWSQVGGGNVPVTLIERKTGSGTRLTFDRTVMKGRPESATPASTQDSTQLVLQQLSGSPGAVSYLNAASLPKAAGSVAAVTIDGVAAGGPSVADGRYPFYSHEHMYTKQGAGGLTVAFINHILSPAYQQGPVARLGYLPVATTNRQSAAD